MKSLGFIRLKLFFLGTLILVVVVCYPKLLQESYGGILPGILLAIGALMLIIAPFYPSSVLFEKIIQESIPRISSTGKATVPNGNATILGVLAVFIAASLLTMIISLLSLWYYIPAHNDTAVHMFADYLVYSLIGASLLAVPILIVSIREMSRFGDVYVQIPATEQYFIFSGEARKQGTEPPVHSK